MKRINFISKSGIILCCSASVLFAGAEENVSEVKKDEDNTVPIEVVVEKETTTDDKKTESSEKKEESKNSSEAPVSAPGAQNKEDKSAKESVVAEKNTIQVSFRDVPEACRGGLYMMNGNGGYEVIKPVIGLFSPRMDMPAYGVVTLYDQAPVDGQPQGKKVFSAKVPEGIKGEILGLIIPSAKDPYEMLFLKKSSIRPGRVFMANTTKEALGVTVDKGQMKEFAPGQQVYLDLGFTEGGNKNMHPVKLHRKDAKGKWYVTRTYALLCRKDVSEIALLVWNEDLKRPDLQKFVLARENLRAE